MQDQTYILQRICAQITLSKTAKKIIERQYQSLGELISNSDTISVEVDIKPQGSYNLGTSIKPLAGSDDDFDIDLVALLDWDLDAETTKQSIGNILSQSNRYKDKLEDEKNRAWTITYENSHVDVVPAISGNSSDILVTNRIATHNYDYRKSSPFKFKDWFIEKGGDIYQILSKSDIEFRNDIEEPEDYQIYTVLQNVVQLLKFHRNKMFEGQDSDLKPISMIITILAAEAYSGQDDLSEALTAVVNGLRKEITFDLNGKPQILNPVNPDENFTDKWDEHPERKVAFYDWLEAVEQDLGTLLDQNDFSYLSRKLNSVYGKDRTENAFKALGKKRSIAQKLGKVDIESNSVFEGRDSGKKAKPHTFWGEQI